MSEQSHGAKLRRRAISGLLWFAPGLVPRLFNLTGPERAAWAMRARPHPVARAGIVTFAVPLVGKHQVSDWDVVNTALARTINSLIAQTDNRWRVVICGQDRPDAVDLDARVNFIPFPDRPDSHDKVPKLDMLTVHCLTDATPGFLMPLDGDDLLSRHLVADILAHPTQGALVSGGYIRDCATGQVAPTRQRSLSQIGQKPFWKFCGSCMALPVGQDTVHEIAFFKGLTQHEHRLYPYLANLAGISLRHMEKPMALYQINHGQNFEARRGRGGFKTRFVAKYAVSDPEQLRQIAHDFALTEDQG